MLDPNIRLEQLISFSILERIDEMLFSVHLMIVARYVYGSASPNRRGYPSPQHTTRYLQLIEKRPAITS